jgi:hypothetical protein
MKGPNDEGDSLMIRRLSAGPLALLKTTITTALLLAATAAGAQTPDVSAEQAKTPAATTPNKDKDADQVGFHDLICKPNGTEDGFDCADEATPAKIVPIPSQVIGGSRPQDQPIIG